MNFSQALEALNQGEAVTIGEPINDGYLVMYKMIDASIGTKLIIHQYPGGQNKEVYEPRQADLHDQSWRILKETEL